MAPECGGSFATDGWALGSHSGEAPAPTQARLRGPARPHRSRKKRTFLLNQCRRREEKSLSMSAGCLYREKRRTSRSRLHACFTVRLTLTPKSAKWQENNIRHNRRQCLGWSRGLQPWDEHSKGTGGNLLPAAPASQHRSHCQRHRHRSHRRPGNK